MSSTEAPGPVVPAMNIALHAVTCHLIDHRLPAVKDMTPRHDDKCVQIHIDETHLAAWLTSGFAVDVRNVTGFDHLTPPTRNWGRVDVDGRLPDSGVRVRLSYFERHDTGPVAGAPTGLRVVTA